MAAEGVLVAEHLQAELAGDEAGLGLVHVPDVPREGVPGELLKAVGTGLLLGPQVVRRLAAGARARARDGGRFQIVGEAWKREVKGKMQNGT